MESADTKKRPSYHDWQLGLKLYDMEYMGINFGKEIQTALVNKNWTRDAEKLE